MTQTAPARAAAVCPACGAEAPGGEVCRDCGRLQPFPHGATHWAVLGLEQRLSLDRSDLERRFHELNRRFHPDYHRLRSSEEQAISLENSAAVNAAYRTLREPVARVEYLLRLAGMPLGTASQTSPPAELFEEILELQEAREELEAADAGAAEALRARLAAACRELEARRAATEAELPSLFPRWDAATGPERDRLLARMRDILATRAYLKTVLRDLGTVLEPVDGRTA